MSIFAADTHYHNSCREATVQYSVSPSCRAMGTTPQPSFALCLRLLQGVGEHVDADADTPGSVEGDSFIEPQVRFAEEDEHVRVAGSGVIATREGAEQHHRQHVAIRLAQRLRPLAQARTHAFTVYPKDANHTNSPPFPRLRGCGSY
jgi:hypothetical protein